jgi:hypothetical protein
MANFAGIGLGAVAGAFVLLARLALEEIEGFVHVSYC